MPLMISRIGHARGRPVLFAAGRWGSITRHSLSVTSVWYRFVSRICCIRVVWVHMVSPGLVSATPWNHAHPSHSTAFETASKKMVGSGCAIIRLTSILGFFTDRVADVRFSNRPVGVKHFQTIHHCSVDVAHGLVLLFGIGTKALVWGVFSQEV